MLVRIAKMSKKPTIQELERILNDPEEHPIEVMPDGSLKVDRRKKGKGFIKTYRGNLDGSY